MERELIATGIGGQGVQLAAQVTARAAVHQGLQVQMFGSYGGMMRGGNTDAAVVLADGPVMAPPVVPSCWIGMAMHHAYLPPLLDKLRSDSLLFVNTSGVEERPHVGAGVTVVDDGTMAKEWGNIAIDDEGNPARRNVLIDDGVLTDYMWDQLRARKEGRPSSGNGRRQSYQHLPMVRMTNTYLLAGTDDPDDIVASTEKGVLVKHLGGGQVNTATGDFVFGMTEAYLIEDGQVTEPLREGNLIGNGPEVLQRIDALGNDFAMGPPGTCGKDGQGVPVGDGVPTLRVSSLTIGGTAA